MFGLWGYAVLIPLIGKHLAPAMSRWLGFDSVFRRHPGERLRSSHGRSRAFADDRAADHGDAARRDRPPARTRCGKRAARLGATRFETIWFVIMPGLRTVLIGACVLAIGRAMGETMAVLMVSGNALGALPPNIYGP